MYQHSAHQESISRKAALCAPDSRNFLGHPVCQDSSWSHMGELKSDLFPIEISQSHETE